MNAGAFHGVNSAHSYQEHLGDFTADSETTDSVSRALFGQSPTTGSPSLAPSHSYGDLTPLKEPTEAHKKAPELVQKLDIDAAETLLSGVVCHAASNASEAEFLRLRTLGLSFEDDLPVLTPPRRLRDIKPKYKRSNSLQMVDEVNKRNLVLHSVNSDKPVSPPSILKKIYAPSSVHGSSAKVSASENPVVAVVAEKSDFARQKPGDGVNNELVNAGITNIDDIEVSAKCLEKAVTEFFVGTYSDPAKYDDMETDSFEVDIVNESQYSCNSPADTSSTREKCVETFGGIPSCSSKDEVVREGIAKGLPTSEGQIGVARVTSSEQHILYAPSLASIAERKQTIVEMFDDMEGDAKCESPMEDSEKPASVDDTAYQENQELLNETDQSQYSGFVGDIEFRIATPNLSRMIDENRSDSSSSTNSVYLSQTAPLSNRNSPARLATLAFSASEELVSSDGYWQDGNPTSEVDWDANPLLKELAETRVRTPVDSNETDTNKRLMRIECDSVAIDSGKQDDFVPPEGEKRAKRGGRGGRKGGRRGRGGLVVKMFDRINLGERAGKASRADEGSSLSSATFSDSPLPRLPQTARRGLGSAVASGRGRRGGRRGRGRGETTSQDGEMVVENEKGNERFGNRDDGFVPDPDESGMDGSFNAEDFHSGRTSSVSDQVSGRGSPLSSAASTSHGSGMLEVERRIEEIQSLVSCIQKQISDDAAVSISDLSAKDQTTKPRARAMDGSGWRSPRHDLKLTIRLGDKQTKKRGYKRKYKDDGEYVPHTKAKKLEKSFLIEDMPKRTSGRKSENDLLIDRMKYQSSFSDESRTPSPQIDNGINYDSQILLSQCKRCSVNLFDFMRCFNIQDLRPKLKDFQFFKDLHRQIRALEKGHAVARMKKAALAVAQVSISRPGTGSSLDGIDIIPDLGEERPGPASAKKRKRMKRLSALAEPASTTADIPPFLNHIDDILEEVIHPKQWRKHNNRSLNGSPCVDNTGSVTIQSTDGVPSQRFLGNNLISKVHHATPSDDRTDVPEGNSDTPPTGLLPVVMRARRKYSCETCPSFCTDDLQCIEEHVLMHSQPFHCSECKSLFSSYIMGVEHSNRVHPLTKPRIVMSRDYKATDYYRVTMVSEPVPALPVRGPPRLVPIAAISPRVPHGDVDPPTLSASSPQSDGQTKNSRNVFEALRKDSKQQEEDEDTPKDMNYQCQLCSFRTDDRQDIEVHLQRNHRSEYQYICRICDLAFCRKRETMVKHFKKWHPGQALDFTTAPGVELNGSLSSGASTTGSGNEHFPSSGLAARPSMDSPVASPASSAGTELVTIHPSTVTTTAVPVAGVVAASRSPGTSTGTTSSTSALPQSSITPSTVSGSLTHTNIDSTSTLAKNIIRAEPSQSCSYRCLLCGAKTDTFDVICAHLEVSHPTSSYTFSCPFCGDYKSKLGSFVAEHIRTAHPSNKCMEKNLEDAHDIVVKEIYIPSPPLSIPEPPPLVRLDAGDSGGQVNKAVDDEVMIVDVGSSPVRKPVQPLSLVHHGPPQSTALPGMVQLSGSLHVPRLEYERYQVFNIKPPVGQVSQLRAQLIHSSQTPHTVSQNIRPPNPQFTYQRPTLQPQLRAQYAQQQQAQNSPDYGQPQTYHQAPSGLNYQLLQNQSHQYATSIIPYPHLMRMMTNEANTTAHAAANQNHLYNGIRPGPQR